MPDSTVYNRLLWTGLAGLAAALLVGIGEFTFQFSTSGGYEEAGYRYFADVSVGRLTFGHFLSTLAAPLYVVGYWHLGQMFVQGGSKRSGWAITLVGAYAFVVGNAWLGGRVFLALTAHQIAAASDPGVVGQLNTLLSDFGAHNEPLVNALRIAMAVVSIIWVKQIVSGHSLYPKWAAIFSPALLLAAIFASYFLIPAVGVWLLPAAMNLVHFVVFGISLYALTQTRRNQGG